MADPKKRPPEDDGRTIADMNITPRERRAMIKGALAVMLPVALGVMLCVAALFMIAYLWLR